MIARPSVTIERVVLAATDVAAVVRFHNLVFGAELTPLDGPDSFHLGDLAGIPLVICPNEIAGVVAEQNRQQFRIAVADLDRAAEAVLEAGGSVIQDETADDRRILGVRDPDGNTYELVTADG